MENPTLQLNLAKHAEIVYTIVMENKKQEVLYEMKYVYNTTGTCCKQFGIEVKDNKLVNLEFVGGCNGNLQGICALVKGMDIDEIIGKIEGIRCGSRATSCPDQLSKALRQIKAREEKAQ